MSEFPARESLLLVDGEPDPYGTDHLGITWAGKDSHLVCVDDSGVIAHAGWSTVELETAGHGQISGVGLGSVLVHRERRGNGIGALLVGEATTRMEKVGRPIGLLFCRPVRVSFYERNGWRRAANEVTVDQPGGRLVMSLEMCWFPLEQHASLPGGPLRLTGLPF